MTERIIQPMVVEYTCDECGARRKSNETAPDWASVQIDSYAVAGGRFSFRINLCPNCVELDKYSWTRQ